MDILHAVKHIPYSSARRRILVAGGKEPILGITIYNNKGNKLNRIKKHKKTKTHKKT